MAKGHGRLADNQKVRATQLFAQFRTPKEVAEALKEEFGVEITPPGALRYDPTKRMSHDLPEKLRARLTAVYEAERKAYVAAVEAVPMAHKVVRMARIEKAYQAADQRGNVVLALDTIERGKKEMDGTLTRHEHSGPGGNPMQYQDVNTMTPEQARAELLALLGRPPEPVTH